MTSSKPFRLLDLPSLAQDAVLPIMEIEDLYHLSKCSRRSRNSVKRFTRRKNYVFEVTANKSSYFLWLWGHNRGSQFCHELRPMRNTDRLCEGMVATNCDDYWAATREEIAYFLDVLAREVRIIHMTDATKAIELMEFLKRANPSPVKCVYHNDGTVVDDEIYKYVLKEMTSAIRIGIGASPSAEFRFDEMQPFQCESVSIDNADWVTVDHLSRCFPNAKDVWLTINPERSQITPARMHQFFNAWRNGSKIELLSLKCDWTKVDFRSMFENVPSREVKRVEVRYRKKVFDDGKCFLIRQEQSGVEAIACVDYLDGNLAFCLTTCFRLLRDDEPDKDDSEDSDSSDGFSERGSSEDEWGYEDYLDNYDDFLYD